MSHRVPYSMATMKTQMLSDAREGAFRLAGFAGNSAPDHVDQLHALADLLGWLDELQKAN